jgi:proliferating cell nuclear antigen PCNA
MLVERNEAPPQEEAPIEVIRLKTSVTNKSSHKKNRKIVLRAECASSKMFLMLFKPVVELMGEVNVMFNSAGMSVSSMDNSHISVCEMLVKRSAFRSYHITKSICLGINIKEFLDILKKVEDGGCPMLIEFYQAQEANDKSDKDRNWYDEDSIILTFISKAGITDTVKMTLMDIDTESIGAIPSQNLNQLSMPPEKLGSIVSRITSLATNAVNIHFFKSRDYEVVGGDAAPKEKRAFVSFYAEDDKKQIREIALNDAIPGIAIDFSGASDCAFSPKILRVASMVGPISDTVILRNSEGTPITIEYPLKEEGGHLRFVIAPKINEDDEGNPKPPEDD